MTATVAIYARSTQCYCRSDLGCDAGTICARLAKLGVRALNPQKRLLPRSVLESCKREAGCELEVCTARQQPCTVVEIEENELKEYYGTIMQAGFDIWPEQDDPASLLYEEIVCSFKPATNAAPATPPVQASEPAEEGDSALNVLYGKLIRVYRNGEAVSNDRRPDRINIVLHGTNDRVIEFWTG